MNHYLRKNIVPVGIEMIFIISCFIIPSNYFIYTNFIFYLSLLVYFVATKAFNLKEWIKNLKQGKQFWKAVWITVLFFMLAFVITTILENVFPQFNTGTIDLKRDSWFKLFLFAVSTIILPSIVEETFFRKSLIFLDNKAAMIFTMIVSMILYAAEHSLTMWGIVLSMLWALPLSISYIKTRNVFIPMTAHFIVNLGGNGSDIIFTIIQRLF